MSSCWSTICWKDSPALNCFCTLVKCQSGIFVWASFWGLCSVPLVCVSVLPWEDALTSLSPSIQRQTGVPVPDSHARCGEVAQTEALYWGTEGGHSKAEGTIPSDSVSRGGQGCCFPIELWCPLLTPSGPSGYPHPIELASPLSNGHISWYPLTTTFCCGVVACVTSAHFHSSF